MPETRERTSVFFLFFSLLLICSFLTSTSPKSQTGDITGVTHPPFSQCLKQFMDMLLNRTNPCFVVIFLQNSQDQQRGMCKVLAIARFLSAMGAIGSTCVAIRTALENELGYRKEDLFNLFKQCELPDIK